MVKLDPMPASSSGRSLTVKTKSRDAKLVRDDVLVGEVWVGSGQSNMNFGLKGAVGGDEAIAAAGTINSVCARSRRASEDEPQESAGGHGSSIRPNDETFLPWLISRQRIAARSWGYRLA